MAEHSDEQVKPRRSRYPRPGTLASAWWERMPDYQVMHAVVPVVATSRHKASLTTDEALALLRAYYGPETTIARIGTWHSVTQRDVECGGVGEADAGDWSEDGSGAAWVRVAYPDEAALSGGEAQP